MLKEEPKACLYFLSFSFMILFCCIYFNYVCKIPMDTKCLHNTYVFKQIILASFFSEQGCVFTENRIPHNVISVDGNPFIYMDSFHRRVVMHIREF